MGGDRETIIPQKTVEDGKSVTVGSVRIHQKGGEIHFHDDEKRLKVAVPADQWMAAYQEMSNHLPATRQFFDPTRKTVLHIKMGVPQKFKKGKVQLLNLRILETDDETVALHTFTFGK